MQGALVKLKIEAYEDAKYAKKTPDTFETLVNPEQYAVQYAIKYDESQAQGTSGTNLKYNQTKPQEFSLDFLFDGTGLIQRKNKASKSPKSLRKQIDLFKKVTLDYQGDTHNPRYLKLFWGTLMVKGRLTNLKISYTLFDPDGTPVRAKATATFKGSVDDQARSAKENNNSPDLTHIRVVKAGDTLPLMTYRIYGTSAHTLAVARANGLKSLTKLTPGQSLYFPPLAPATQS